MGFSANHNLPGRRQSFRLYQSSLGYKYISKNIHNINNEEQIKHTKASFSIHETNYEKKKQYQKRRIQKTRFQVLGEKHQIHN